MIWITFIKVLKNAKYKMLIVFFFDMVSDMLSEQEFNLIETKLFIRDKKFNISLVFIRQTYFAVPKNIKLSSSIMKIPSKQEFQQIKFNHSSDIVSQDFMNLYKICAAKPFSFLVITF